MFAYQKLKRLVCYSEVACVCMCECATVHRWLKIVSSKYLAVYGFRDGADKILT